MFIPIDRCKPRGDQVYNHLRGEILTGNLTPGARLPATRTLAEDLGLSRTTVLLAYQKLRQEGYIEARGAAGTMVAPDIPTERLPNARRVPAESHAAGPAAQISVYAGRLLKHPTIFAPLSGRLRRGLRYDFSHNLTLDDKPAVKVWNRILRRLAGQAEDLPGIFDPEPRVTPLQEVLADYLLHTRGVRCLPEQVRIVTGPQQAFQLTARLLIDPGHTAIIEEPHYIGVRHALLSVGARLRPVPVDDAGLVVDALPRRARGVRLLYAVPSHQWPTGAVLPHGRRVKLLQWAARHRVFILENDHNCEYRYDGPPIESLQGIDPSDRVIYVGTLARHFSPLLRVGYAVVPRQLLPAYRAAETIESPRPSTLEQEVLAEFIAGGHLERLTRRIRCRAAEQREALYNALREHLGDHLTLIRPSAGFHIYGRLDHLKIGEVERLVHRAEERGVGLYPDTPFHLRAPARAGIIFGIGKLSAPEIDAGIRRVARLLV